MTWYVTKMIFRISDANASQMIQFDEQWRLILATDKQAAIKKAETIGKSESETIVQQNGNKVMWEFMTVTDLFAFDAASDGSEIFSRIEQPDNISNYLHNLELRSAFVREGLLMEAN